MARVSLGLVLTGSLHLPAFANPQGGTVTDGAATITESGNRVDIHQSTDKVIIDWRSFSIGAGEITEFHQPSAGSIALNRVTGADPSHIFGTLRANGRVFLINPNGILFGAGSRVDVSGLVATTSDIRNEDFMAGRMDFSIPSLNPNASVVNEGDITIAQSGYAALVAPHVRNSGVINARLGRVSLGAAEAFTLDLYGDELVTFTVGVRETPVDEDGNAVESLVDNQGSILAGGGIVQLGARNVEAVVRNVINTDGVIYAGSMERVNGKIVLKAAGAGNVAVSGALTADGGRVEISGDEDVSVSDATVTASDVTIAADADGSGTGDLNAGPTGGDALIDDVDIDTAAGGDGTGGRVEITGDRVALTGETSIDVAGTSGGGEVLIGGDYQGQGETRSADATIVGSDVRINADALDAGDGVYVILWADGYTRFHGEITARGGATGGNGGFVEVSGKQHLDFVGHVDTSAILGNPGTLLLDPINILISADNTDGDNGGTIAFADSPGVDPWNVSPAALDGVNGNITLEASGDITVDSDLTLNTAAATLTMRANNDIDINADITTTGGAIVLSADHDDSGAGDVDIAASQTVTSGGTAITVSANDVNFAGSINSGAGTTTILVSDGGTIKVGGNPTFDMTISGSELQNITATNLVIGDATNGNIDVKSVSAANSNNIGTVTLNATQAGSTVVWSTGGGSTFNALVINTNNAFSASQAMTTDTGGITINSQNGVTFSENVTSAGAVTIDADSDNNGSGTFTVDATFALDSTNNTIQVTADDIVVNGTIDSGSAATTILVSDGGTIGVGATAGNMTISGAELQNITATGLTIGDATSGSITVDGITAANSNNISGTVTLDATAAAATITFTNGASTFNALTANAGNGITANIGLATDTGGLTLSSGNGVTISNTLTTAGATVIDADNDDNGSGTFTLNNTLNTANNTLSITADDIALNSTINTGGAATTVLVSDGGTIGLGNTAGNMTISGAELQNITATGLTIGDATNGDITVDGISAANSNNISGTFTLNATADNASVAFSNGASTFNALAVSADDGISVNVALTTDTGNLTLDGDADNAADTNDNIAVATGVTLTSAGSMTLDATNSGIVGAGTLTLNAASGIGLNDSLVTNGATVFDADTDNDGSGDFSIIAARTITTNGNTLSITANDIALSGNINSGAASTTLLVSDGGTIGLGATAGNMTISGAELQNITATGLTIGDATNGNVTIDGITAANSNNISGTLTVNATGAGRSITFANTASTFNAITADADDRISVNVDLTADTDHISLDGDADDTADTNDDIQFAAGVTLTATGPISLDAATGNMNGAGALTIDAGNGITIFADLTTAGNTQIDADTDNNGTGTFTVGAGDTLNTTNNVLTIVADDIDLSGSVNTGSAAASIAVSDGGTIGLGATGGNMTISGAELQNFTATGLTIGDSNTGNITVNGISAANSNNISGTLTLNAAADDSSLTFATGASTFNALTANADDRIAINVNVTTDTGDLDLDGDIDNSADVNDDISFAAGVTLDAAGAVTLDSTSGSMTGSGALTINANTDITINDSLTTVGATVFDADDDTNGSGTFTIAASRTVTTNGNTLQISANKMVISGALNSGAAATTLTPTNGAAIDLGSAADAAGNTVELSNTELQSITASELTIGDAGTGAITVSADVTPGATAGSGVTNVFLVTGSSLTSTAGGIVESNLSITAAGAVTLSDTTTDMDKIAISTSTGDVDYTDLDGFTIGAVGSVNGISTGAGSVSATATTGNISIDDTAAANDISATTTIDITAQADNRTITIAAGADVESTGGAHTYTADNLAITGTITATGQTVTLGSSTAGDNVADTLELAGTEIQNITAANLNIGGSAAGSFTVDGITAANSNNISGTVTLIAGGNGSSITF